MRDIQSDAETTFDYESELPNRFACKQLQAILLEMDLKNFKY